MVNRARTSYCRTAKGEWTAVYLSVAVYLPVYYLCVLPVCVTCICYLCVLPMCVTCVCYLCVTYVCYLCVLPVCVTCVCYLCVLPVCVTCICYLCMLPVRCCCSCLTTSTGVKSRMNAGCQSSFRTESNMKPCRERVSHVHASFIVCSFCTLHVKIFILVDNLIFTLCIVTVTIV